MRIFFGMLDQAVVNSRIMWKLKVGDTSQSTSAIIVLKKLISHLTVPMFDRIIPSDRAKMVIESILKTDDN